MRYRNLIFVVLVSALVILGAGSVFSQDIIPPKPAGAVSDHFRQLHPKVKEKIEEIAEELRGKTSINLVVVAVRSIEPLDAQTFGQKLYQDWDVGRQEKGLEHGVLLLLSILDREVKIFSGRGVDYILTPRIKEDIQWGVFPSLGRGKISEGAMIGAISISRLILEEYPRYERMRRTRMNLRRLSLMAFFLTITAVLLTLIFGQTFLAAFGMVVGGLFGYLLLDGFGLVLGAAIGFLVNFLAIKREEDEAEKEAKRLYEEFKAKKKKLREGKNEGQS